ncbi:uncharacterized protein KY384_004077 [Bacidia gigantensis]|uniref:uncharacterized protein n=1 Tax=Bacidia gigantensis TaxID=2732470 RepID=UPI001D03D029|nr:uncharacterized protein KY384_004077 [Bacidia gigantensis]KAG8530720.1 hypothetical protein KY384_004077 [Bacidia gigantensis]
MANQQNPYGSNGPPPPYSQQQFPPYGPPLVSYNQQYPQQSYNQYPQQPYNQYPPQPYNYPVQPPVQQDLKPPYPPQSGQQHQQSPYHSPNLRPQASPQHTPYGSPLPSPHVSPSFNHAQPVQQGGTTEPLSLLLPRRPGKTGAILNATTSAALYTFRTHSWSKPHLTLTSASGQDVGSLTMHSMSSRIDAVLHGRPISLESNGMMRSGHHFNSTTQLGAMKWKNDGMSVSKQLTAQGGGGGVAAEVVVARWDVSTWSLKKEGKLILHDGRFSRGVGLDEVILSLLAELETDKRSAAAVEGASAGAGAGC